MERDRYNWNIVRKVNQKLPPELREVLDALRPSSALVLPVVLTDDGAVILRRTDFEDWFGDLQLEGDRDDEFQQ